MQRAKQNIKQYANDFKEIYDISSILKYAIILNITLFGIERSKLLQKVEVDPINITIGVLLIMLVFVIIIQLNLISSLKLKIVNNVDAVLLIILISSFIYFFISWAVLGFDLSRICKCIFILAICTVALVWRIYLICKQNTEQNEHTNIYTLKDLYDGNIDESEELILIDEDSADYDLLDREIFINNLYNIIVNCNPDKKFVIGLEGPWGSGKTTILNIVKKKIKDNNENIIIIDDFDPWSYDNKESLFIDMFDTILRKTEFKYSMSKSKNMINNLYSVLFSDEKRAKIKALGLYNEENFVQVNKVKSMINNYIKKCNKKIIFIIDNIDRAEKENITLIFKLVNNIFDFENITYVLAFDDEQIKKIMKEDLNIDYNYLKKIVQLEIKLPKIDKSVNEELVKKCMKNLIKLNGVEEQYLNRFDGIISHIGELIDDIRDLKRFINSVIAFTFKTNKFLSATDILSIELIKMQNIELYESIWRNRRFFISQDKQFFDITEGFRNNTRFNEEGKKYFNELFSNKENKKYLNLLKYMFPYVESYSSNQDLEQTRTLIIPNNKEYANITRKRSICSGKFFELYFTYNCNEFIEISNNVENFIIYVNELQNRQELINYLKEIINKIPISYHKIFFETMQFYIEYIKDNKLLDVLYSLYENIYYIDNSSGFFGLDARRRSIAIISDVILKISEEEFNQFLENIKKQYTNLNILDQIYYWIEHNNDYNTKEIRSNSLKERLKKMAFEIYDNNIDIYQNEYREGNIYAIYRLLKDNQRDIKLYVSNILTENNIFRFLYDIISKPVGSDGYSYLLKKEEFDSFTTVEKIDELINRRTNNTEDEKFVLDVYEKFKEGKTDSFGRSGLVYDHEVKLNL